MQMSNHNLIADPKVGKIRVTEVNETLKGVNIYFLFSVSMISCTSRPVYIVYMKCISTLGIIKRSKVLLPRSP